VLSGVNHPVVGHSAANTSYTAAAAADDDDDDDGSQFDVTASYFQHLLHTNMGSCSAERSVA